MAKALKACLVTARFPFGGFLLYVERRVGD